MSCDVNDNAPEEISEYATFRQRSPLLDCFAFALLFALNLAPFFCGGDDVPDDDQTFFIYLRTFKQGSQAKGHCHGSLMFLPDHGPHIASFAFLIS